MAAQTATAELKADMNLTVRMMDCLSAVSLAEKTADRMVRLMGCSLEVPCKHNKGVVSLGLP